MPSYSRCAAPVPSPPGRGRGAARAALCAGLFAFLASSAAHAITFSDTEFADADWTTISLEFASPGGGDVATGFQVASGGNPDAYRRSELAFSPDPGPDVLEQLIGHHLRVGAIYDPSTQGAIATIDLGYDVLVENLSGGAIVLRQGGIFYYGLTAQISSGSTWQNIAALGETSDRFLACESRFGAICAGAGTGSPDFSTSGGPIEFGFYQAVATGSSNSSGFQSRVDNWFVTVNPVPEPGTATLMLTGLLLLSRARERKR